MSEQAGQASMDSTSVGSLARASSSPDLRHTLASVTRNSEERVLHKEFLRKDNSGQSRAHSHGRDHTFEPDTAARTSVFPGVATQSPQQQLSQVVRIFHDPPKNHPVCVPSERSVDGGFGSQDAPSTITTAMLPRKDYDHRHPPATPEDRIHVSTDSNSIVNTSRTVFAAVTGMRRRARTSFIRRQRRETPVEMLRQTPGLVAYGAVDSQPFFGIRRLFQLRQRAQRITRSLARVSDTLKPSELSETLSELDDKSEMDPADHDVLRQPSLFHEVSDTRKFDENCQGADTVVVLELGSLGTSDSLSPADSTASGLGGKHFQSRRRRSKLKFLEFDENGNFRERSLSRHDILDEVNGDRDAAHVFMKASDGKKKLSKSQLTALTAVRDFPIKLKNERERDRRSRNCKGRPYTASRKPISGQRYGPMPNMLAKTGNSPLALTMRDIRQVDPAFVAKAALWVRDTCIVVSLEPIRAIILHDKVFMFDPDNEKTKQPIKYLGRRLTFAARNAEEAFMPFEFRVLEGILIHSCETVERDFHKIEQNLLDLLRTLPAHVSPNYLEHLRVEEQRLNHFSAQVRKFQNLLQTVLDTDEDMANMYLTEKHKAPSIRRNPMDHDEAEVLLESYLQVVDDLTSRAGLLDRAIDDIENVIDIHLGTKQIQLLKLTIRLTMILMLLGFATAIFGIFAMNLPLMYEMRNLPSSQYYHYGTVAVTVTAVGVSVVLVTRWCHRQGQGLYTRRRRMCFKRQDLDACIHDDVGCGEDINPADVERIPMPVECGPLESFEDAGHNETENVVLSSEPGIVRHCNRPPTQPGNVELAANEQDALSTSSRSSLSLLTTSVAPEQVLVPLVIGREQDQFRTVARLTDTLPLSIRMDGLARSSSSPDLTSSPAPVTWPCENENQWSESVHEYRHSDNSYDLEKDNVQPLSFSANTSISVPGIGQEENLAGVENSSEIHPASEIIVIPAVTEVERRRLPRRNFISSLRRNRAKSNSASSADLAEQPRERVTLSRARWKFLARQRVASIFEQQHSSNSGTISRCVMPRLSDMDASRLEDETNRKDPNYQSLTHPGPELGPNSKANAPAKHICIRRRRMHELKFLEFDENGRYRERSLTRQEVLEEVVGHRATISGFPADSLGGKSPGRDQNSAINPREQLYQKVANDRDRKKKNRNLRSKVLASRVAAVPGALKRASANVGPQKSRMSLTMRDIRQVDPAFTAKAALWVRENCMLVSLETVRAIILRDRLLLFDADNENLRQPITYIQQRLAFGVRNSEEAFMPFEFRALEGILIHSCISVERDFYRIEKGLLVLLETLPTHSGPEYLERLRLEEQGLNYLFSRIRKFQYVLQTVLDTDEDMANMYLTEKFKTPEVRKNPMDHEEAEMLLESYLQVVDDLTSRAGLLNQAIDDTENLIEINLDTKRNQLLQVTIRINTFSTVFGFGTAVTGIFGMMLPVPSVMTDLPTSQYFFYGAVAFVLFGIVLMIFVVTRWCRRLGQGLYTRRNSWWSRLRGQ